MFSLLIVFDVICLLDSLFSLASLWLPDQTKNKTTQIIIPVAGNTSEEDKITHIALFLGEVLCFLILLLCNSLGISGVQNKAPYLLVPWLGVYMLGILSCYIASFIYFFSQFYDHGLTFAPLVPAITGLVFHAGWSFVNSVFNDLRAERRLG